MLLLRNLLCPLCHAMRVRGGTSMHAMRENSRSRISTQALACAGICSSQLHSASPRPRAVVLALSLCLTLLPLHSGFALSTKARDGNTQAHASNACASSKQAYVSIRQQAKAHASNEHVQQAGVSACNIATPHAKEKALHRARTHSYPTRLFFFTPYLFNSCSS